MSKIDELIAGLCPNGVEYKSLGEIGSYVKSKVPVSSVTSATYTGVECLIKDFGGRRNAESIPATGKCTEVKSGDVLLGNIRPNLRKIWLSDCDGGASNDVLVFRLTVEPLLPKYLYYTLAGECFFDFNMQHARGGKMPRGNKVMILAYQIPVPPIEIQREIVRILDSFAELEARRAQYAYYHDKLLDFTERESVSWLKLGDIGRVSMCKRIIKNQTSSAGEIPFYKIGTFGKAADSYIGRDLFEEYRAKYPFPSKGDILISASGTIGRTVIYDGSDSYFQDSNIVWIANDESVVLNRFLMYVYSVLEWKTEGGTIKRLYGTTLANTVIPVPPLSEQRRIVDILDRFEALTTSLSDGLPAEIEARRQQYEHYRDKLLDFSRKVA